MARYTDNYGGARSSGPMIYNDEELRIVMVGKTGAGKSATGNTILGREEFISEFSAESVTKSSATGLVEMDGQQIKIIDTPGLFDTTTDENTTIENVKKCISYAAPGPHVFLIVIGLGRFTPEEKQTVQMIQKIFGAEAPRYSMVLFTHGDQLKRQSIEDFLKKSKDLKELVGKCNNQYHVFNNELKDRSQVRELLQKIRKITVNNGGHHYTNEMFQAAERKIQEEKERILKEEEAKKKKELDALREEIAKQFEKQLTELKEEVRQQKEARIRELENKLLRLKLEKSFRSHAEERVKIVQVETCAIM